MRTTYLTQLTTAFNPFSLTSRVPRLFLNHLPPNAHKLIQIKCTTLPQASSAPAFLEIAFKDGQKRRYEWSEEDVKPAQQPAQQAGADATNPKNKRKVTTLQNIIAEVDRHARITQRKEELNG